MHGRQGLRATTRTIATGGRRGVLVSPSTSFARATQPRPDANRTQCAIGEGGPEPSSRVTPDVSLRRATRFCNRAVLAIFLAACCVLHAAEPNTPESAIPPAENTDVRTQLAQHGIALDLGYTSETAHNVSGGTRQLTRYTDQWTLAASFDLDTLLHWNASRFQVVVTERSGRDLGADAHIGNNQQVQEVYGRGQTWHLSVFAFAHEFFDGRLGWRIGRLPVGDDMASFSCDFQNLTFCGAQPGNIVGDYWVNGPTSQWASVLKLRTGDATSVRIGAYQLNPKYVDDAYARHHGLSLDNPGTQGWLLPLEFGWTPQREHVQQNYKFGVWYDTAGGDDLYLDVDRAARALSDAAPLQRDARYGAYMSLQQEWNRAGDDRRLTLFFNATQADRATSVTDRQIALGLELHSPFGRSADFIGAAVGATHANGRAAAYQRLYDSAHPGDARLLQGGNEYVGELFYNVAISRFVDLRPNLQYILHPGGSSQRDDALVIGFKVGVRFFGQ